MRDNKNSPTTTRRKKAATSAQGLKRLFIFLYSASLLSWVGLASEIPIMTDAIATMSTVNSNSESAPSSIAHSYKSFTSTTYSYTDQMWYRI